MPTDEKVEKVEHPQPLCEFDDGSTAVVWERDGKNYALTTRADGTIVFTVSPFSKATPPLVTTIQKLRAALAAAEAGEPVAWRHTLHMERGQTQVRLSDDPDDEPFGTPGVDCSHEYSVTTEPLFASPPSEASRDERAAIRKEALEEAAGEPTQDQLDRLRRIAPRAKAIAARAGTMHPAWDIIDDAERLLACKETLASGARAEIAAWLIERLSNHVIIDALEFYADKSRWREYAHDEVAAGFDRNMGSDFGDDEGQKARDALAAIRARGER